VGEPPLGPGRLADFLRAAADFLWESDRELRLVWLCETASSVLARPIRELIGRRWAELAFEPANAAVEPADPVPPLGAECFVPGRPFRDRRVSLLGGDGRLRILETSAVPLVDRAGRFVGYRGIAREVGERVRAEQRLRFLAAHDPLTGAANRLSLASALARAVERAARGGHRVGLVIVDLDGFKQVNDALGHGAGDSVLRTVVHRLREGLAAGDLVARLGGDEFALLMAEAGRSEDLAARLEALERRLTEPISVAGAAVALGASCGLALWPDHGQGLEELLARADQQMYRVKRARRAGSGAPDREREGAPAVG
jgi:diguanylate cyclase (GGDEF)-like protein